MKITLCLISTLSGKTAKKSEDTLGIAELAAELDKQSVEPSDTNTCSF